ncbi:MAG: DUF1569 domain-containing protein [Pyrinomonadaceae bacterium]
MKSLFEEEGKQEILDRIDALEADLKPLWGTMGPAQAMEHCSRALEMAMGKRVIKQKLLFKLISWYYKESFLGEKEFPKNSPTGPDFIVADQPDLAMVTEKTRNLISEFAGMGARGVDGNIHGFFGALTGEQWGVTQYKHFDHHLRQFGG